MPSSPNYVRDYKQEYRTDSPLRKAKRRSRLKARRKLMKAGVAKKGDGARPRYRAWSIPGGM